jgi:hypothetical protein
MNAVAKPAELKPGIYEGIPMAEYLAMPAASASMMIELITRCPRAAWHGSWLNPHRPDDESTEAQSVGTLAHAQLLEGSKAQLAVIDPQDYPAEKTGNLPDGWTNKAIRAARDPEVAAGVDAMVAAAREFLAATIHNEPEICRLFTPTGGKSEVTIVWEEDGFLFRMRPDRLALNYALQVDVKTTKTSAEPESWGRKQLFGMNYFIAAAFYRRGLLAATGKRSKYVYLAQEQDAPYLCSLVGLDREGEDLGDRRIERAISIWKDCCKRGHWPAYPTCVAYPEAPKWEFTREEAIEAGGGIPYDYEKMGWRKPERLGFEHEHAPINFD